LKPIANHGVSKIFRLKGWRTDITRINPEPFIEFASQFVGEARINIGAS